MKERVIELLFNGLQKMNLQVEKSKIEKHLEIPSNVEVGDFSFPVFFLAEELKEEPNFFAKKLKASIGNYSLTEFDDISTNGPYVNFFIDRKDLARKTVWEIINAREKFGKNKIGRKFLGFHKKIVIECSSPDLAKPFSAESVRQIIVSNAISKLYKNSEFKTIKINYFQDLSIDFGKILAGYELFGDEKKLRKNSFKHLLEVYKKIGKSKKYEQKINDARERLRNGEEKAVLLWRMLQENSTEKIQEFYEKIGIKNDINEYEVETIKEIEKIYLEIKNKGFIISDKKGDYFLYKKFGGRCLLKDKENHFSDEMKIIANAFYRYKKYSFDKMIYVCSSKKFEKLLKVKKILEDLGVSWRENLIEIPVATYLNSNGKLILFNFGKSNSIENFLKTLKDKLKYWLKKNFEELNEENLKRIVIANLIYSGLVEDLKISTRLETKNIVDDKRKNFLFVQKAYSDACLKLKNFPEIKKEFIIGDMNNFEIKLIKKLNSYLEVLKKAYLNSNPSEIAEYCYSLCKIYFEAEKNYLSENNKNLMFAIAIIESFRQILRNSTQILGIELIEK